MFFCKMRQKKVIIIKLLLGVIIPIWRCKRQRYEVAKLKFGKSTSKSIKLLIFKTPGKLSRKPLFFQPNDHTILGN